MFNLQGKRAVITGATGGIGSAIARKYAQAGAHLVLIDKDVHRLELLDDELSSFDIESLLVPLDLKEADKISTLGPLLQNRFNSIDLFVSAAGVLGMLAPISSVCQDVWDEVFRVNVLANVTLIKTLEPLLKCSSAAHALFIGSDIDEKNPAYWAPYTASQSALKSIVACWKNEVKNTIPTLNIHWMNPGEVKTPFLSEAFPGRDVSNMISPDDIAELAIQYLGG